MYKIDTECLISSVQRHPILWQDGHKDYKNKKITDKKWNEVGEMCNCSGAAAKAKWKNLKDTFRKALQKHLKAFSGSETQPMKPKWPYYEQMSFIRHTVDPDPTAGNLRESDDCTLSKNKRKRETTNLDAELLQLEKERFNLFKQEVEKKEEDNDDIQFFKSLLPFLAKLNDLEKLEVRGEIQNVILTKLKRKNSENLPK